MFTRNVIHQCNITIKISELIRMPRCRFSFLSSRQISRELLDTNSMYKTRELSLLPELRLRH